MTFGSLLLLAVTLLLLLRKIVCEECSPLQHSLETNETLLMDTDVPHPFLRQRLLSDEENVFLESLEGQPAAASNAVPPRCDFASDCPTGLGCLRQQCGFCRKNANCRQNSSLKWVCDKSGDVRTCVECTNSDQTNCKVGWTCDNNKCVQVGPLDEPKPCFDARDCFPGLGCVDSTCQLCEADDHCIQDPNGNEDRICDTSGVYHTCVECTDENKSLCPENSSCINNKCVPEEPSCAVASDCFPGLGCVDNKCKPCQKDIHCLQDPAGFLEFVCDTSGIYNSCVECTASEQDNCNYGQKCVNKKCVKDECNLASDCMGGLDCVAGSDGVHECGTSIDVSGPTEPGKKLLLGRVQRECSVGAEPPGLFQVKDVIVVLEDEGGVVIHDTISDKDGEYFFPHIPPGTYDIKFTHPFCEKKIETVTVQDDDDDTVFKLPDMKFTNCHAAIGGKMWYDEDNDGIIHVSDHEGPMAGKHVVLKKESLGGAFVEVANAHTGSDGGYLFDGLSNGKYKVFFYPQLGDSGNYCGPSPHTVDNAIVAMDAVYGKFYDTYSFDLTCAEPLKFNLNGGFICGACPGMHGCGDCNTKGDMTSPGCSCASCMAAVCDNGHPSCCTTAWDETCKKQTETHCFCNIFQ